MTQKRKGQLQWVGPVTVLDTNLYAVRGSGIRISTLEDAKQVKQIATVADYYSEQMLQQEGFTNLVSSKDPVENVKQLMNGEVQLSIFTNLTIPEIVKEAGYSMDDLEPVYTVSHSDFYIAISRDTPAETVELWRNILNELKRDGTFEKIYRSYLPQEELNDLIDEK